MVTAVRLYNGLHGSTTVFFLVVSLLLLQVQCLESFYQRRMGVVIRRVPGVDVGGALVLFLQSDLANHATQHKHVFVNMRLHHRRN